MKSGLAAESPSDVGNMHADRAVRDSERTAHKMSNCVRGLAGCPDLDPTSRKGFGDGSMSFHRHVLYGRVVESAADANISGGKCSIGVSGADLLMMSDVRVLLGKEHTLHVLVGVKIGMNQRRAVVDRLTRVENGRERIVFDSNLCTGFPRCIEADCGDCGDWFALVSNDISGEDSLVLHIEPEVIIEVGSGQNGTDAGNGFGFSGVDGDDLRRGDRRGDQGGVQHPRKGKIMRELGLPCHLVDRISSCDRCADISEFVRHSMPSFLHASVPRQARLR